MNTGSSWFPSRRDLLAGTAATVGLSAAGPLARAADPWLPVSASKLPRWRGFNLLEKFTLQGNRRYDAWDFDFVAAHGFNFVRFPMDYRIWTTEAGDLREEALTEIDDGVAMAHARGIHVALCLHRAPGYCINPPNEPLDLWGDGPDSDHARQLFAAQWRMFAKRYKGIPSSKLSFNLVNEPPTVTGAQYVRVATAAVEAIRQEDPDRLVFADGRGGGHDPTPELAPLKIAQGARGYQPFQLSHYRAGWVAGSDAWPEPTWPLTLKSQGDEGPIDQAYLWKHEIEPWRKLEALGIGVMVGEWGAYRYTPHEVVLAWMRDCLQNWKKAGWGWALWNLRGDFGPLNSGRTDVAYVDYKGAKLDQAMLDLLQQY